MLAFFLGKNDSKNPLAQFLKNRGQQHYYNIKNIVLWH